MALLANRAQAAATPEAIKSPATALTLGSAGAASLATLATVYNETFHSIFGDSAGASIKAAVLIAVIAAWALIAVADIVGRAIAKAATERAAGLKAAAEVTASATSTPSTVILPTTLAAKNLDGADETGFLAVATRIVDGKNEVMLIKDACTPVWVRYDKVEFPGQPLPAA